MRAENSVARTRFTQATSFENWAGELMSTEAMTVLAYSGVMCNSAGFSEILVMVGINSSFLFPAFLIWAFDGVSTTAGLGASVVCLEILGFLLLGRGSSTPELVLGFGVFLSDDGFVIRKTVGTLVEAFVRDWFFAVFIRGAVATRGTAVGIFSEGGTGRDSAGPSGAVMVFATHSGSSSSSQDLL